MTSFLTSIVGNNFRGPQDRAALLQLTVGATLTLVRDAENEYDAFAVQVHGLDADGNDCFLGFVPKTENPEIADLLDQGEEASSVTVIGLENRNKPSIQIVFDDEAGEASD